MFAALLLVATQTPGLTEIHPPKGWDMGTTVGLSPKGVVVFEVFKWESDEESVVLWQGGKTKMFRFVNTGGFGLDEPAAQNLTINGFLADGTFFGHRTYGFNGASSTWMQRPFVARDGKISPVLLPKELHEWNDISALAIRPDGAVLVRGQESTTNTMMGDPDTYVGQLMWIKNAKVIEKVANAEGPFMDKNGRIVAATQYANKDNVVESKATRNRWPHLLIWKNGKPVRGQEGEVVAVLDNGDIIFKQQEVVESNASNDNPNPIFFKRLRDGVVTDVKIPGGLPRYVHEVYFDRRGHGMLQGFDGKDLIVRAFDRTRFQDLKLPAPYKEGRIDMYAEGWYILSGELPSADGESTGTHYFVGRVP